MSQYVSILCANLKGNLGDFAILESMVGQATHHLPESEVQVLFHRNKGIDKARHDASILEAEVPCTLAGSLPSYKRSRALRSLGKIKMARGLYQRWHNREIEKRSQSLQKVSLFRDVVSKSELVLFAGGAQWGRGDLNLNMFAQLKAASDMRRTVRAFPFSISDGVRNCNGSQGMRQLFGYLEKPLFVRDIITHESLSRAAVQSDLVCDCVFALADPSNGVWDLHRLDQAARKRVCISVTRSGLSGPGAMVSLIEQLRELSLEPILLTTCEIEDRSFLDEIQSAVDVEVSAPDTWRQAVKMLSESLFVMTNRLHCLIFSAHSGVPVIPVTNRSKVDAYRRDANLPHWLPSVESATCEALKAFQEDLKLVSERQCDYRDRCVALLQSKLPALFSRPNSAVD